MTEGPITSAEAAERVCRKCGSKIFADAPHGFCGLCLFKTALGPVEGDQESDAESIPLKFEPGFDDYELLQEIGRGGQAVVYRARQKSLNRIVALKIIGAGAWGTPGRLKRFRLEAEAAASLNHPSIVPIHDIGEREDCCFFSMNLIDGQRLDEVVGDRPMSSHRAAQLLVKLARTVQYAHDHGILHRDLKPGNILIDQDGEPHLTDFGLARLVETESNVTRTLEFLGTPSYMAPEQARGQNDRLTTTTDVYGLGAVFYQLLTGRPPFVGASAYETVRLLLESEPKSPRLLNPKVDRDLSTVCLKCLEKDAQLRYPSALALAEDLERWLRREPIDARPAGLFTRGSKWLRRNPATAFAIVCLTALIAVLALVVWQTKFVHPPRVTGIAVLPFENLSGNRDGALYADGVQDDILTKLSKIAELKVISRTSVMQYRGPRNLRQIGQALGVSHILEGSVRRDSGKLHLNAQLVDARSDTQIWAEQYDGDLGDLFVIQGKIAQDVAEQLHARISFVEKSAIQRAPTADIAAFDLYTRAKNLFLAATNSNSGKEELLEAADLLNQALTRDRFYFEAYCQLGGIHDLLYILGHDHSPSRLALAKAAVDAALRLRPKAGEAHLARADMLFRGYLNYDQALGELDLARKSLPNDSRVFELAGFIQNRRGHFEQALTEFEHAMALDPRNVYRLEQMGQIYWFCRRYPEVQAVYERALQIEPNNVQLRIYRADLDMAWKADTRAVHQVIDSLRESNPRAIHEIADSWVLCALADRDPTAIRAALIAAGENPPLNDNAMHFSNSFIEGWIARLEQNGPHARSAFEAARAEQEKLAQSQPDYAPPLCILGVIDALLGRKEQALNECQRASELLPVEKDAFNGPIIIQWSAIAAAWVGDNDRALEQLGAAARIPGTLSYGWLKLLPFWDPLRDDPRFNEIVNSLAPR